MEKFSCENKNLLNTVLIIKFFIATKAVIALFALLFDIICYFLDFAVSLGLHIMSYCSSLIYFSKTLKYEEYFTIMTQKHTHTINKHRKKKIH